MGIVHIELRSLQASATRTSVIDLFWFLSCPSSGNRVLITVDREQDKESRLAVGVWCLAVRS